MTKRIALMGMHLEAHAFAPTSTEDDFRTSGYYVGEDIIKDLSQKNPRTPAELSGFVGEMTRRGLDWEPVPILITGSEPGGPVDHDFFERTKAEMKTRLEAARPLDGVFFSAHGAMTSTESTDPDGALFEMVRSVVGSEVPLIATLDLHANISERMVKQADILVSYITNPHVDQRERAAEAAGLMLEMFGGMKPEPVFIRVPMVSPPVTLLSAEGPYADLINYGQTNKTGSIANVSLLAGFAYGNTPENGMAIIVTGRNDRMAAASLAHDIAQRAWDSRYRFNPSLTSIADAVARAKSCGNDPSLPPVIMADCADNPGGGGRGNTPHVLRALVEADVQGCFAGIFYDKALAAEAHDLGIGAQFTAVLNREPENPFSERYTFDAEVAGLHNGTCVGTLGIYAGRTIDLGKSAHLQVGGIALIVVSRRKQCGDAEFFQMFNLKMEAARSVLVKSRGHFRAGFLPWFPPEQVIEIDAPGLTSNVFDNFSFNGFNRPIYPLDKDMTWKAP